MINRDIWFVIQFTNQQFYVEGTRNSTPFLNEASRYATFKLAMEKRGILVRQNDVDGLEIRPVQLDIQLLD